MKIMIRYDNTNIFVEFEGKELYRYHTPENNGHLVELLCGVLRSLGYTVETHIEW